MIFFMVMYIIFQFSSFDWIWYGYWIAVMTLRLMISTSFLSCICWMSLASWPEANEWFLSLHLVFIFYNAVRVQWFSLFKNTSTQSHMGISRWDFTSRSARSIFSKKQIKHEWFWSGYFLVLEITFLKKPWKWV